MSARLSLVARIRKAARAVKAIGDRSCEISFHRVTFEEAAELFEAGYRPVLWTNNISGPNTTYFDLTAHLDGVRVVVWTISRPATAAEIAAVNPPAPAPVLITPPVIPVSVPATNGSASRWSMLEVD